MAPEDWPEQRKKFVPRSKTRWGGGVKILALTPPLPLTVHSNSKSNMASHINDRKLMTLAHPNEMPALQAKGILA